MRGLVWPLLVAVLLVLQSTCFGTFSGELLFDLPLLFVYNYALLRGPQLGAACGLALGLLQDLLTPSILGFHVLTRVATGLYCGGMTEFVFKGRYVLHMGTVFIISLLARVVLLVPMLMFNGRIMLELLPMYAFNAVLYAAGNAVLVVPLGLLMRALNDWVTADDLHWGGETPTVHGEKKPLSLNGRHLNRKR